MINCFGERASRKSGPTAEVDRLLEEGGFAGGVAGGQHRLEQKRGAAIAEVTDQRGLEFWRILIEQRPNISLRHRCNTFIAKQHEPQTAACRSSASAWRACLNALIAAWRSPSRSRTSPSVNQ